MSDILFCLLIYEINQVARYETTLSVIDLSLEDNITVSGYIKWYQNSEQIYKISLSNLRAYVFYFNREMGRKILSSLIWGLYFRPILDILVFSSQWMGRKRSLLGFNSVQK